ncbi:MAG: hypothetical protein AAGA87_04405 [Pseudomonadota bacterium]
MRPVIAIRPESLAHIRNVARSLQRQISRTLEPCALCECDTVDAADGDLVFVIGEHFARFHRRPERTYVYFNFSVVEVLGNPLVTTPSGWRQARYKASLMRRKLDLFDAVLDYYPPQTQVLQRKLPVPVFGFPVSVDPADIDPGPTAYDVCFVGGLNPRRRAVLDRLQASGLTVSPHSGVTLEDVAARSRLTLNIHALRSNHLETPRLIGAIATGSPVLTERSYGIDTLVPPGLIPVAPTRRLARDAMHMLAHPSELEALRHRVTVWYQDRYLPDCATAWDRLAEHLTALRQPTGGRSPTMQPASGSARPSCDRSPAGEPSPSLR